MLNIDYVLYLVQTFILNAMIELALFEPEIPHNTGALMRLCACLGVTLNLIQPYGFVLSDKYLKRAAMDYRDLTHVVEYSCWKSFKESKVEKRIIKIDPLGTQNLFDFQFQNNDIVLMGKESIGFPESFAHELESCPSIHIPMVEGVRSINLALSATMILTESLRQTRYVLS